MTSSRRNDPARCDVTPLPSMPPSTSDCPNCDHTGRINALPCPTCRPADYADVIDALVQNSEPDSTWGH